MAWRGGVEGTGLRLHARLGGGAVGRHVLHSLEAEVEDRNQAVARLQDKAKKTKKEHEIELKG